MNNCVCIKKDWPGRGNLIYCQIVKQYKVLLFYTEAVLYIRIKSFSRGLLLKSTYGTFNLAGSHQDIHLIATDKSSLDRRWQSALSALLTFLKRGPVLCLA